MNQPMRNALAEDSPQRMDVIGKLAAAQARTDKRYKPITLEFLKMSVSEFSVAGWDTFDVDIRDISEGGRVRQQRTVVITDKFANFVEHPDYTGIMIHIPATERNMKCLASAHMDHRWNIVQDDVREEIEEMASHIVPLRNPDAENAQPDIMGHVESEVDILKRKIAQLEGREVVAQPQESEVQHVGQPSTPNVPAEKTTPMESVELQVEKSKAQDAELTERAKAAVYEEESEAIEAMKKKSKNFWNTKAYKETILPKILAKKDALAG